jgi:hypothetical protein
MVCQLIIVVVIISFKLDLLFQTELKKLTQKILKIL